MDFTIATTPRTPVQINVTESPMRPRTIQRVSFSTEGRSICLSNSAWTDSTVCLPLFSVGSGVMLLGYRKNGPRNYRAYLQWLLWHCRHRALRLLCYTSNYSQDASILGCTCRSRLHRSTCNTQTYVGRNSGYACPNTTPFSLYSQTSSPCNAA